ncbi:MarR family transcriptional regulator [Hymenobacter lutimineralis]|uniref:MarR family transcriptional regulator n=1 Tax=Hymenobacter lutimineralis TaxID=2606448 RepID=A0A5D6V712_9BACT|nr:MULTISPECIES: MarR family transcriptional regulator [Hymenobacter]QIX62890.1 MarR family transcriptional regulator [Hymenobacter sp. BT18]TYZ10965.1 MarR family transcriptional regulator [Hymenobacter lutimineralis]
MDSHLSPTDKAELLKLENQLCFPLYAVSRMLTKAYQPFLQELDLTYPQYLVLLLLWEHRELTVKELGDKLLLDSGTLTPLLKRMEQKQWVSRRRAPHDERSVIISILPAGDTLQQRACQIPEQLLERMQLSIPEFEALRLQLNTLLTRLT